MFRIRIHRRRAMYATLAALMVVALGASLALAQEGENSSGGRAAAGKSIKQVKPSAGKGARRAKEAPTNGIDEVRPAPGAFGADVPVTYQGPPPSSVEKELIGPLELLRAGETDLDKGR